MDLTWDILQQVPAHSNLHMDHLEALDSLQT